MTVELLMGASGYGKTYNLYKRIIEEAMVNPENKYILIVPEQSSMQAQKDIVRMHPKGGVFNIDVLTFGRLGYRIFEELCVELNETIDDTGKMLIIRKVVNKVADRLKVIRISNKFGIISEIKSMLSEFKQYGITPDGLESIINDMQGSDRLKEKLSDVLVIYREFEAYIEDKFVTAEDKPEELLKVIGKSSFFDGSVVAFDGFTGFTLVQYRIIERVIEKSDRVICTVTFPTDTDYNTPVSEEDLFHMSKVMMTRLGELADRLGAATVYNRPETDKSKYRFSKSPELEFLEKELFRYSGKEYMDEVKDITIKCLPSPKEEVLLAASDILKQVREQGLRFRDIAIVTGDLELYKSDIIRVFTECNIPYFMDNKRSLIGNPVVEYLRAAIGVILENYSYESVFRFMKNKLCPIESDKVNIIENYVLSLGIRGGNKWHSMFERKYPGKGYELLDINATREQFVFLMEPVEKIFSRQNSVSEYVVSLYEFMEAADCYEYLNELSECLTEDVIDAEQLSKASEYRQTYKKIIELLEQLNNLMGEEVVSPEEFAEILDAGFEEIKVGIIPPSVDSVTIGDIERTRLEHVKYMMVLGVNEGVLPKLSGKNGVLSDRERRVLSDNNVELSPTPREKVFIQNFYIYLNLTEPECGLSLSYHRFTSSSKECKPSRIIGMIKKMYPKLKVIMDTDLNTADWITNGENSLHYMAHAIIDKEKAAEGTKELLAYLYDCEPYKSRINNIIATYVKENMPESMSEDVAKELYGDIQKSSITRIEKYAGCAFSHFLQYGLELNERLLHEIDNLDIGNLFHKVIELISSKLKADNKDFSMLDSDERLQLVENTVMDATADFKESIFIENETNHYLKKRIVDILDRTVWALGVQLQNGQFKPELFETSFYDEVCKTIITGKIDRVDLCRKDDKIYVKIIDYKSSTKEILLEDVYRGTNLQLLVYLHSIVKNLKEKYPDKEIIPAGVLYNHMDNPIVRIEVGKVNKTESEEKLLEKFAPDGIVCFETIEQLDGAFEGKSKAIPVTKKKDGSVSLSDKVVTKEQLECLSEFAVNKMHSMEAEILSGKSHVNPYEGACNYCNYASVCGFNSKKDKFRKSEEFSKATDKWVKLGYKSQEGGE